MSRYMCLESCEGLKGERFQKGRVYDIEELPTGGSFAAYSGDVESHADVAFKTDMDDTLYLDKVGWEVLRFPSISINPVGATDAPELDTEDGTLKFSPTEIEAVSGVSGIPHSAKRGGKVVIAIHWMGTSDNTGDVVWLVQRRTALPGTGYSDYETTTMTVANPGDGIHTISVIDEFLSVDTDLMGVMTHLRLARVGTDAADTYADDAKLLELTVGFEIDSFGSGKLLRK